MVIECECCGTPYVKSRDNFPWGPKKVKYCVTCIDNIFNDILKELNIDFERIEEEING